MPIGLLEIFTENVVFLTKSGQGYYFILFYVAFWGLGPIYDSVKWGEGGLDKSTLQERRPIIYFKQRSSQTFQPQ